MKEENLKNNVIIPFLNSIGFKESSLTFEDNFTIRLGKNVVKKKDYISGRLDILVKLNNNPFLLWELKKEELPITEEEVKQAISYARLTDEITPFTIVSNGKETYIYNTFDKKNINKDDIKEDYKIPNFNETISYRLEALSEIICYSDKNIIKFLKNINERELNRVLDNKYIKDLYVEREDVHHEFEKFLINNKKVFFITGESGIGKTNVMCNLLEKYMDNTMILFYNACFVSYSLLVQILNDFNFGFDEQLINRQLFSRINLLAKKANKNFIIFIDAIDELAIQNSTAEIDNLLNILLEYSNIKICLSCKESFIEVYENINGNSSILKSIERTNVKLNAFNDLEKDKIIKKYKNYYNVSFSELTEKELKDYCNNGFLFRVIFETYKDKTIVDNIHDLSIIEKYIEVISKNYNISKKDLSYSLTLLGEIFANSKDNSLRLVTIGEDKADTLFRIRRCNITIDNLINMNILQKYISDDIPYIDFNFKPLSYYAITILYGELNKKSGRDFKITLFELNNNRRGKESLKWYDKYIKNFQHSDVYDFKKEYGLRLIEQYRDIVNKHFPSIRDKFELNEDINNIGIAIDNDCSCVIDSYSFYRKTNIKDNVRLIDFREENVFMKNEIISHTYTMGLIDIEEIIKRKLTEIIKTKKLNEDNCQYLTVEYILNMIFHFGKIYDYDYKFEKTNFIPNFNEFLPLDLVDLSKKIILFNIKWLKRMDMIDKDSNENELYNKLIQGEINIPECNYGTDQGRVPIYALVNRVLSLINKFDIKTIKEAHILLPKEGNKPTHASRVSDVIIESFTKDELSKYLKDLLEKYVNEYIIIVEDNFPTLKDKMTYYTMFKNGVILDLYLCKKEQGFLGSYTKRLAYCYNDKSTNNEIIVNICDQKDMPQKPIYRYCSYISGDISSLFLDNYINNSLIRHMVLSNLVYSLLDNDIKAVLETEEKIFF